MGSKIKVYVFKPKGRKFFQAQWTDPTTGKAKTKSTKETGKRDADRFAGDLESQLNDGRYHDATSMTWSEFTDVYESEKEWAADGTLKRWLTVSSLITEIINPKSPAVIDEKQISKFKAGMRKRGAKDTTIKGHLAYLRSALNWAKRRGHLNNTPHFEMPKGTDVAKGRPITGEEFERMLEAIPKVRPRQAVQWAWYLRGLWWSGLRLRESLKLRWDANSPLAVDMSGKHPVIKIRTGAQKNGKAETLPLAPEFAEMLRSVPESDRHGPVFHLRPTKGDTETLCDASVTLTVKAFAERANVNTADEEGKAQWATPHDFRRSFGSRWAKRVMPAVLMRLMRHRTMATTMAYYATNDADAVADAAYAAMENLDSSNTFTNTSQNDGQKTTKTAG